LEQECSPEPNRTALFGGSFLVGGPLFRLGEAKKGSISVRLGTFCNVRNVAQIEWELIRTFMAVGGLEPPTSCLKRQETLPESGFESAFDRSEYDAEQPPRKAVDRQVLRSVCSGESKRQLRLLRLQR